MKFTDLGDKGPQFKLQNVAEEFVDEANLAQMRDYFAGKMSLTDEPTKSKPGELARMRDHFSKEKPMAGRGTTPNSITSKMPPDIVMILHAVNKGTAITKAQFSRLQAYKMYGESVEGVAEGFNGEYDDEAGMAKTNLHTMARAANGLLDTIGDNENLPEWAQEKIAKAEMMVTGVWDYLLSQEEQGIDPKVDEASLASMRDYFSQPDNNTVKVDNKYGAPERKQPANVPPEIQIIINKMYRVGKITPQELDILKRFQAKTGINVGLKIKEAGILFASTQDE
jgi:hypothetical protein